MQITNNQPQTFTGIKIQLHKMNQKQKNLSHNMSDIIDYSNEYNKVKDSVDVYFLPGKDKNKVVAKFIDCDSDMFFKQGERPVSVTFDNTKESGRILGKLEDIANGKFKAPEFNLSKIINSETDLAKIEDNAYTEFLKEIEEAKHDSNPFAQDCVIGSYRAKRRNDVLR